MSNLSFDVGKPTPVRRQRYVFTNGQIVTLAFLTAYIIAAVGLGIYFITKATIP